MIYESINCIKVCNPISIESDPEKGFCPYYSIDKMQEIEPTLSSIKEK